jgi:hypothetical protein
MVNPKVLELFRKYADEHDSMPLKNVNISSIEDEKINKISHELHLKLKTVLVELEHDTSILKMRGFDQDMLKLFTEVWRHLENIYFRFSQFNPHQTARQIVEYLNDKHTKSVINNLIFLTEHHVKTTNVPGFIPGKALINPEIKGLKLLLQLEKFAEEILRQPTLSPSQPTWRPPSTQSMQAVKIPKLPPLKTITPLPPEPSSKKKI